MKDIKNRCTKTSSCIMNKSKWNNKLGITPPSSVCFTLTQEDDDNDNDGSELTEDNDNHYHKHPTTSRRIEKRELRELKEKLDILSSRLIQCETENEVLQAEKAVLVDEMALSQQQRQQSSSSQPTMRRSWFSTKAGVGDMNINGGSMQLLVDTNARLMLDNAKLEVMVDAIRKSFESYIKDSRRNSAENKAKIKSLLRLSMSERTRETCPLGNSFVTDTKAPAVEEDCHPPAPAPNNNNNNDDASKVDDDASIHQEERILRKSLDSIPEVDKLLFGTSGDDWIIEGEDLDDDDAMAREERKASRKSKCCRGSALMQSVLIMDDENNETSTSDFVPAAVAVADQQQKCDGIVPTAPSKDTNTTAIIEESALISEGSTIRTTRRNSLDLLVEFGETERDTSRIGGERRGRSNSLMERHTRSRAIGERRGRSNSVMELNRYFLNGDTTTTTTTNCDQEDVDGVSSRKTNIKSNGSIKGRPSGRLYHSITEGTCVGRRKNENVIVDFPQRKARILWSSLKL